MKKFKSDHLKICPWVQTYTKTYTVKQIQLEETCMWKILCMLVNCKVPVSGLQWASEMPAGHEYGV